MIEFLLPPLQRWAFFTGVLLLVGIPAWRSFVEPGLRRAFRQESGEAVAALEERMARAGLLLSLALFPFWGLRLCVQLLGFRDPFAPVSEDLRFLVLETFWGAIWVAQGLLLLAVAGVFAFIRLGIHSRMTSMPASGADRFAPRWLVVWLGGLLLALTLSLSSHAMSAPGNRVLAVAADTVHTLAAGAWIGTLALILAFLPSGPLRRAFFAVQLRSFSPLAMWAVGLLFSTGGYLAVTHLTDVRDIWTSSYGRLLTAKIGFVGVALVSGFLNRRGLPKLDSLEGAGTVSRRAAFEVVTAAVIVLITAILVGSSLPRGAP